MGYITIIIYILGWLSVSSIHMSDEDFFNDPIFKSSHKIKETLLATFFIWWMTPFVFIAGFISEAIKYRKANK